MTALSVVVANTVAPEPADRSVAALVSQLRPDDELVWVDGAGAGCPWSGATTVTAGSGASLGELYARGMAAARNTRLAFTDSSTVPAAGWRDAAAHAARAVAGGPVEPTRPRSIRDWAGFFVEYGPHAVAPYTSASGDVSGNNVVYDRGALESVVGAGEPVWKTAVNLRLRARGHRPAVLEGMRVRSAKRYTRRDLGRGRAVAGRRYAHQRAAAWRRTHRVAAAVSCVALPVLAYARLAARIGTDSTLRRPFVVSTPAILFALVCWSAGEAWGYLTDDGRTHDAR